MTFQVAKISVEIEENSKAANSNLDIVSFFSVASAPNTTWGESSSENRQNSDGKHKISTDDADGWIYLYESGKANDYPYTSLNSVVLLVNNPDYQVGGSGTVDGGTGYICLTYDEMNDSGTEVSTYNTFVRGKHYIFKITNVYTRGYDTIEEALNNPGNVDYEVVISDDWSLDYDYNGQYALLTAVDTAYVVFPTTSATDLVRFGVALPEGNSGQNIITTEVSLVRVKNGEFESVDTDEVQLCDASGNPAGNNVLTIKSSDISSTEGYMLQYTTGDEIVEGMYLHIEYGNIEKLITLPSVRFTCTIGDIPVSGGTVDVSVTKEVWFPGEDAQTDDNYSDYTVSLVDESDNETNYEWVEVNNDGNLDVDAQPDAEFGSPVTNVNLAISNGFDDTETTANCYIVNAPGTYYFPLVYGNGIKNGEPNSAAYTNQAPSELGCNDFEDHTGATITQPYIYEKYIPAGAFIVWQDSEDMVTDVAIDSDGKNMTFKVPSPIANEGNAVLAVTDASDNILWSWHIWVTAYNPYNTSETTKVTNHDNVTYYLMNNYLGSYTVNNPERSAIVQIRPDDIDVPGFTITVTQSGSLSVGDVCYYQSGRKDPFPGIQGGKNGVNKTTYGKYCWPSGETTSAGDYVADMNYKYLEILSPHVLNSESESYSIPGIAWTTTTVRGLNYWNAALTSRETSADPSNKLTVKTVYDPCPSGFCIGPHGVFSAFFKEKTDIRDVGELNLENYVSDDDEVLHILTPYNESYDMMVVPYRNGTTGIIYNDYTYSVYHASNFYQRYNVNYNYGCLMSDGTDISRAYLSRANYTLPYNVRAIIPVKEPSSDTSW